MDRLIKHRAYTLYEVLLAVAILGFVVTPLLFMFRSSVSTMQRGKSNLQALFLAQRVIEKIKHDLADPVNGYNVYQELHTNNWQEFRKPLVNDRPDRLKIVGEMVKGYSTVAVAVANPQVQLEAGDVPLEPSKYFLDVEDTNGDGVYDQEGIKNEGDYEDLYRTLSRYLVTVAVEDEDHHFACGAPMKKIIVTVQWIDKQGQPQSLSLFTWEGPNASKL